ncbi:MAG: metallopeptidase family protein [Phycisphaerae bacterium]
MPFEVSRNRFAKLVEQALAELPGPIRQVLDEVSVEIRDRPTRRELKDVGLEEDELLLGLYVGRPLTERSVLDPPTIPDAVFIFQEDVQEVSNSAEDLVREVRTTVLHELGHHLGMDEDDLAELGYE